MPIVNVALLFCAIHFAPVEKDASACGGGFKRYIVDTNMQKLSKKFHQYQGFNDEVYIKILSPSEVIASNANYEGRYIYIFAQYRIGEKNTWLISLEKDIGLKNLLGR